MFGFSITTDPRYLGNTGKLTVRKLQWWNHKHLAMPNYLNAIYANLLRADGMAIVRYYIHMTFDNNPRYYGYTRSEVSL